MDIHEIYGLTHGRFLEEVFSIDNQFIRQLYALSRQEAVNGKVVSFIQKDKMQNRGEIQQRGVKAGDKSVIDICKLTPLSGIYGSKNILHEVASYRAESLDFQNVSPTFAKDNAEILMVDYLLSACLCYVEVFDSTIKVDKFLATRNRFIAAAVTGVSPEETASYTSYLQSFPHNYQSKQIKVLKLNVLKKGFKVSQPKSFLDFNRSIKVTPLFLMSSFVEGITSVLQDNIVRIKYIKDNMTEREFYTTTNASILLKYYDQGFVQMMMSNMGSHLNRGYIRLPELGCSKYDASGVRAINISRITSIDVVSSFDDRFIDVDFNMIMPAFKSTIDRITDVGILIAIYEDLTGSRPTFDSLYELKSLIISFVDDQYATGTTMAQRYLHTYMVQRDKIFNSYHGGKPQQYGSMGYGFNLGG